MSLSTIDECNFDEICRTCLKQDNDLCDLFDTVIIKESDDPIQNYYVKDVILSFVVIEIDKDDKLPLKICTKCMTNAENAFMFKKQCEESDVMLRKVLNNKLENSNLQETEIYEIKIETIQNHLNEEENFVLDEEDQEEEQEVEMIVVEEEEERLKITVTEDILSDNAINDEEKINIPILLKNSKEINKICIEEIPNLDIPVFTCAECNEKFINKMSMNRHIKLEHKRFKCGTCKQNFSHTQTLTRHMKIHEPNQRNKLCTFCGKCFLRADDLKRHTRIHTGERPYKCDQCDKSYKQTSELKEHQKSHLNIKCYVCSYCGKALATRNGLFVHLKAHKGQKDHECKICGNKYVTTSELNSHFKHIHSQKKSFRCQYEGCDKSFVTKMSMQKHFRVHSGEKPYQCKICGKCVSTTSSLQEHHQCNICIRKLGEKPYECKICFEKFICGSTLKTHTKLKHMEKQFRCVKCNQMFALSTKLRQHMKIHINDDDEQQLQEQQVEELFCSMCGILFTQNIKYQYHMKLHEQKHLNNLSIISSQNEESIIRNGSDVEDNGCVAEEQDKNIGTTLLDDYIPNYI